MTVRENMPNIELTESPLLVSVSGSGIANVVLNRPRFLNAMNHDMMRELATTLRALEANPAVRVVALSGAGRGFSSGWDRADGSDQSNREALEIDALGREVMIALGEMRTTLTVAGLHGPVVGGGALIAVGCDIRVAATDTFLLMPEIAFGNPILWTGLAPFVREIGMSRTRYLVMSNQRVDAAWCLTAGLVHEVVPAGQLDDRVGQLALELASIPSRGIQLMKDDFGRLAPTHSDHHGHTALTVLESLTAGSFQNL